MNVSYEAFSTVGQGLVQNGPFPWYGRMVQNTPSCRANDAERQQKQKQITSFKKLSPFFSRSHRAICHPARYMYFCSFCTIRPYRYKGPFSSYQTWQALFSRENITCYQAALLPFCLGDEWKRRVLFILFLRPPSFALSPKKKKPDRRLKKRRTAYLWRWPSRPCFLQRTFFVNMSRILLDKRRNLFENIPRPFWKQNIVL